MLDLIICILIGMFWGVVGKTLWDKMCSYEFEEDYEELEESDIE